MSISIDQETKENLKIVNLHLLNKRFFFDSQ